MSFLNLRKAKSILDCIKRGMARSSVEVILPLYSPPIRPHLDCIHLWGPQHKKDVDLWKKIQRAKDHRSGAFLL